MGDVVQCPGCYRRIDVSRPSGAEYEVKRGRASDGRDIITIWVGRIVVHRCRLCVDGFWR